MISGLKILVVDDEPPIRRLLRTTLSAHGYQVSEADSGGAAVAQLESVGPEVVVLDLGLPDMDGLEVVREIRSRSQVPIVVLSVRDDEIGKVQALDLGADDYMTKPFGMEELLARLRTARRRRLQEKGARPVITVDGLTIDLVRRRVRREGEDLHLSRKEYDILALLVTHAGKVVTHSEILETVWGHGFGEEVQYLRVYVRQLRQKIELDPARPKLISTEPGVGYRFQMGE